MADGIDPFKHVGRPDQWQKFGTSEHDLRCDAERRAMADYMLRRLQKAHRRGHENGTADLLTGGIVAFAGLFVAGAGGPAALDEESFEKWIGIATFAWYQAISCHESGAAMGSVQ
ncbi:hypothetical protein MRBLMA1_001204 [Sphingobium sp. LMA1-1-1.1]|uniref:hypothetical protein n=1 Tax=Sphingobium sp. LMA1-1-1.1 TaxID=3135238 RepID=UPI00341A26C5